MDDNLKNILDRINDGMYMVDQSRVVTYWNRAAERITGFSADEVIGRSCSDNILTHVNSDGENLCSGLCPLAEALTDGIGQEVNIYLHHKLGHRIPVAVRITVIKDSKGKPVGGVELFSDMVGKPLLP